VRDDRQARPQWSLAAAIERGPFVRIHRHVRAGPHLADRAPPLGGRLPMEIVGNLIRGLAQRPGG
jgi:hypothetical protein